MPVNLVVAARQSGRGEWLETLAETVSQCARRWSLTVDAPFQPGGQTAWVAPAVMSDGTHLVLKLLWPHHEAEHEAEGLRIWRGQGTVRLFASERFPNTIALLLERCEPGTSLALLPEPDQDVVIAGLLRRLWLEPPPGSGFRPLTEMCDLWAAEFEDKVVAGQISIDRRHARRAMELFRSLPEAPDRQALLCTDLHAGNVLSAQREPWLAIDPKPYVGDPTYDALQHMLNCDERLLADPTGLAHRMAGLLGLDPERLLLWLFARCVQESPEHAVLGEVASLIAP